MRMVLVVAALVLLLAVASGTNAGTNSPKVVARSSSYGRIIFDGRGFVLYAFTHDRRGRSTCSGACAKAWPPYIVSRKPKAGNGVKSTRIGAVRRGDGRLQATYAGHPLYYYVGDRKPGQILCQGVSQFGGFWRVVRRGGTPVR